MSMNGYLKMIDDHDLQHLESHPAHVEELIDQDCAKNELVDLDKAWAALHFVIAGDIYPDGDAVLSGALVGEHIVDFDLAYGPPAFLLAEEVQELSTQLQQITEEDLEAALTSERFSEADIYPFSESGDDPEQIVEYVAPYFERLKTFYQLAADKGKGVLIWLM